MDTNPLLDEINGLSPGAKAALQQAHSQQLQTTMGTQAPQLASVRQPQQAATEPPTPSMQAPSQAPTVPAMQGPKVQAPRGTVEGDQAALSKLIGQKPALETVYSKIRDSSFGQNHPVAGRVLGALAQIPATAADIGLSRGLPRIGSLVPGSTVQHGLQAEGLSKQVAAEQGEREKAAEIQQKQATAGEQTALAGLHEKQGAAAELTPATAEEAKAFGIPEGTPLNAAIRGALAKQAGINTTKIQTTQMSNQAKEDIAAANNLTKEQVAKLKPEQRDDRAIRLMEKPPEQRTQEENAYLGAYAKWVQQTKVAPGIARAQAMEMFRPVQVIGDNGEVHYDFSGHAIQTGESSTGSIPFQTARTVARAFTTGPQSAQLNAFRTATDHLQLLRGYADALQNGDVQAINRLKNEFQTQFGQPAPTNFATLAEMLSGELASVMSKGGATVTEIGEMRKKLSDAQSPEEITGIIDTNQNAINEKANELLQQYIAGEQGQPVFQPLSAGGTNPTNLPKAPTHETGAPKVGTEKTYQGKTYRFKGGDQYDQKNWPEVKK